MGQVMRGLGYSSHQRSPKKPRISFDHDAPLMTFVKPASHQTPSDTTPIRFVKPSATTSNQPKDNGDLLKKSSQFPKDDDENDDDHHAHDDATARSSSAPKEDSQASMSASAAFPSRWGSASSVKKANETVSTSSTKSGMKSNLSSNDGMKAKSDWKSSDPKKAKMAQRKSEAVLDKMKRKGFAKFEASGTGFGSKYLAKMGFTGRLGKEKKGIVEPIAVVVRPKNMGIGFGDFTEANELPENQRIDRVRKGAEADGYHGISDDSDDGYHGNSSFSRYKGRENDPLDQALKSLWQDARKDRKKDRGGRKRQGKSGGIERDGGLTAGQPILDMTGRHARLVTDMKEINRGASDSSSSGSDEGSDESDGSGSSGSDSDAEKGGLYPSKIGSDGTAKEVGPALSRIRWKKILREKRFGRELVYNVKSLAELKAAELSALRRKEEKLTTHRQTLTKRIENLSASLQVSAAKVERTKLLHARLSTILQTASQPSYSLDDLSKGIMSLRREFASEVQNLPTFPAIVIGIASRFTQQVWTKEQPKVLSESVVQAYEELFSRLGQMVPTGAGNLQMMDMLSTELHAHMAAQIKRSWGTENQSIISLLQVLDKEEGFERISNDLKNDVVIPALLADVTAWTWSHQYKDASSLFQLVSPWYRLRLQGEIRRTIHREVRMKLETAMKEMLIRGMSEQDGQAAVQMVEPWAGVFSLETFGKLVDRGIMPVLVERMRQTEINPASQDTAVFDTAMGFARFIQPSRIVALLLSCFLPKWLRVLGKWLDHVETAEQIQDTLRWYFQWKKRFPKKLLAAEPLLWQRFDLALVWIQRKASGESVDKSTPECADADYTATLRKIVMKPKETEEEKRYEGTARRKTGEKDESSTREFREVVQDLADAHGMTLMRHEKEKQKDGKAVYVLNGQEVYFQENVMWMRDTQHRGQWHPTELRQCFDIAMGS